MARSPSHRARSRRETAASAAVRALEQQKINKLAERVSCAPGVRRSYSRDRCLPPPPRSVEDPHAQLFSYRL